MRTHWTEDTGDGETFTGSQEFREPSRDWKFIIVDECNKLPLCVFQRSVSHQCNVLFGLAAINDLKARALGEGNNEWFRRTRGIVVCDDRHLEIQFDRGTLVVCDPIVCS